MAYIGKEEFSHTLSGMVKGSPTYCFLHKAARNVSLGCAVIGLLSIPFGSAYARDGIYEEVLNDGIEDALHFAEIYNILKEGQQSNADDTYRQGEGTWDPATPVPTQQLTYKQRAYQQVFAHGSRNITLVSVATGVNLHDMEEVSEAVFGDTIDSSTKRVIVECIEQHADELGTAESIEDIQNEEKIALRDNAIEAVHTYSDIVSRYYAENSPSTGLLSLISEDEGYALVTSPDYVLSGKDGGRTLGTSLEEEFAKSLEEDSRNQENDLGSGNTGNTNARPNTSFTTDDGEEIERLTWSSGDIGSITQMPSPIGTDEPVTTSFMKEHSGNGLDNTLDDLIGQNETPHFAISIVDIETANEIVKLENPSWDVPDKDVFAEDSDYDDLTMGIVELEDDDEDVVDITGSTPFDEKTRKKEIAAQTKDDPDVERAMTITKGEQSWQASKDSWTVSRRDTDTLVITGRWKEIQRKASATSSKQADLLSTPEGIR